MEKKHIKRSLRVRILAAVYLSFWMAAFVFCSGMPLSSGKCHTVPTPSHHETASSDHDDHHTDAHDDAHPHNDSEEPAQDPFCNSLDEINFAAFKESALVKPGFSIAHCNLILSGGFLTKIPLNAPASRQPPDRVSSSTHEVYLGIAHQTHAPPLL